MSQIFNSHNTIANLSGDIELADTEIQRLEDCIKAMQERLAIVRRCRNGLVSVRQTMNDAVYPSANNSLDRAKAVAYQTPPASLMAGHETSKG